MRSQVRSRLRIVSMTTFGTNELAYVQDRDTGLCRLSKIGRKACFFGTCSLPLRTARELLCFV